MLPQIAIPVRPTGLPPLDSPSHGAGGPVGRNGGTDILALGRVGGGAGKIVREFAGKEYVKGFNYKHAELKQD